MTTHTEATPSDTPRTDALVARQMQELRDEGSDSMVVGHCTERAEFARTLERENAEMRNMLIRARDFAESMSKVFADPNFTDRYDDETRCKNMCTRIDALLSQSKS